MSADLNYIQCGQFVPVEAVVTATPNFRPSGNSVNAAACPNVYQEDTYGQLYVNWPYPYTWHPFPTFGEYRQFWREPVFPMTEEQIKEWAREAGKEAARQSHQNITMDPDKFPLAPVLPTSQVTGWICARCGKSWAPFVGCCDCKPVQAEAPTQEEPTP